MKVLICGSRGYEDIPKIAGFIATLGDDDEVIVGGAAGADRHAETLATLRGLQVHVFHPDWTTHGKAAGPIRNQKMVDACDYGVAFWDGESRGTKDSIRRLKRAGKYREVDD